MEESRKIKPPGLQVVRVGVLARRGCKVGKGLEFVAEKEGPQGERDQVVCFGYPE